MKKRRWNRAAHALAAAAMFTVAAAGCGRSEDLQRESPGSEGDITVISSQIDRTSGSGGGTAGESNAQTAAELEVRFGDDGEPFVLSLEDNETADAIARHVGTSDWRLPIYHYDDYENWEVMQYYDIPGRYEIPSSAENVTSEKAGEVYYSEPNRIILFYEDGSVTGDYTKIGRIENSDEFRDAVENNPVLEGWGNKIVLINSMD